MRQMFITCVVTAVLAIGSSYVNAQHSAGGPMDAIPEYLGLNDAQKVKAKPIIDEANVQMALVDKLPAEKKREKVNATVLKMAERLRPILTAEQLPKLDAMKKNHEGGK